MLARFQFSAQRVIDHPRSFLFRIAKHLALSHLNRKSRQITAYLEDSLDASEMTAQSSPDEELSASQVLALHYEAVINLSLQQRRIYPLRKLCDCFVRERTELPGCPKPKRRVRRGP